MREDARQSVSTSFESYVNKRSHFDFTPCLVHGDFGMTNILYSSVKKEISGVIDFGGVSIGDPAYDFAGILASYGLVGKEMGLYVGDGYGLGGTIKFED